MTGPAAAPPAEAIRLYFAAQPDEWHTIIKACGVHGPRSAPPSLPGAESLAAAGRREAARAG